MAGAMEETNNASSIYSSYDLAEGKVKEKLDEAVKAPNRRKQSTRTLRRKLIFEGTQDIAFLLDKVRQDLLLEEHRREREGDLLVDDVEVSADVPRGLGRRVGHLVDKRNMERLQPRRGQHRGWQWQWQRRGRGRSRRPVSLQRGRVELGGGRDVVRGHVHVHVAHRRHRDGLVALSRAAASRVLLALEPPRAVIVRADGVSDEEEVVDGERELLVAERTLGEEQAREELGRVPEQRAVLVLKRRVRHLCVHVHVVHHPSAGTNTTSSTAGAGTTSTPTTASPDADTAVFDGRCTPRGRRDRC